MRVDVQSNALDRAIRYVAPQWGARRVQARMVMAIADGYTGASADRAATKNWIPWPGAAENLLIDLPLLRGRSRDMERSDPIATGAIHTMVSNVVGTGLSLLARPDRDTLRMSEDQAQEWSAKTQREFRLWAESNECDITRTQDFYAQQNLVFRSSLVSGDVFVLMPMIERPHWPYSLALQVIEADRVDTPEISGWDGISKNKDNGNSIRAGIEFDDNGAPVAYYVLKQHPGSTSGVNRDANRVLAFGQKTGRRNMLHLFERLRPGQTRGYPFLAPVIEPLKQLGRYTQAELDAAVINAMLAVFVKSPVGMGLVQSVNPDDPNSATEVALRSGTITDLRPGEEVQTVAMNRPNQAFDPFVQAVLRQVGVALGLPFEVLIKHFTASYSAARAALLEAWRTFKGRREWLGSGFCTPVYETWLEEAVARGRVIAPGFDDPMVRRAWMQSEWVGDSQGQIDPVREVEAANLRVESEFSSRTRETQQLSGAEWTEIHAERVREERLRRQDGTAGESPATAAAVPSPPANEVDEEPEEETD